MEEFERSLKAKEDQIIEMEKALNYNEQYGRRFNIEIHGLAYSPGEDITNKLDELAGKINVKPFSTTAVEASHRLPVKSPDKVPVVLIRFKERSDAQLWLRAKTQVKKISCEAPYQGIFICENLTRQNKNILRLTKEQAKAKGYAYVWVRNGRIFAKENESSKRVCIEHESDIHRL